MQQNFVRNGFSEENFCRYMCLDFLKNSFSDKLFHHYMYPKIVLVTNFFVTKYDLINLSVFSDEIFSSLNSVFSKENIQQQNVFVAKSQQQNVSNKICSDELPTKTFSNIMVKNVSSLNVFLVKNTIQQRKCFVAKNTLVY